MQQNGLVMCLIYEGEVKRMVYHVFNKSIEEFKIFNNYYEYLRMVSAIFYYQREKPSMRFCRFISLSGKQHTNAMLSLSEKKKVVEVVAYCIMPTHPHFILEELKKNGIAMFLKDLLNSYTRYFNIKYQRKGPLWESRSKKIKIKSDEQLLHVTRYVHLNPVTAYLVDKPEDWPYSSYREYTQKGSLGEKRCRYTHLLNIEQEEYKKFVEDGIVYQRQHKELTKIKGIIFE
ncbi:MAG: transposase [Candidatus Omnitrophica bacterium]|nr:transposase [Candidatus Omnitrophota bacterium]